MEVKLKQRLVGIVVLVVLMLIVVPLLFTGSKKTTINGELSSSIPTPPPVPIVKPVSLQPTVQATQPVSAVPVAVKTVTTEAGPVIVVPKAKIVKQESAVKKVFTVKKPHLVVKKPINKPKRWAVQLGSFSSEQHAVNLVKKLRAKNVHAYTRSAKIGVKNIYRVYVGPEANKAKADLIKQRMQKEFKLPGLVVKI